MVGGDFDYLESFIRNIFDSHIRYAIRSMEV